MMQSYLGPLGSLVGFKCPSAISVSPASRSSFRVTLDGLVKEQRGKRGRRVWSVDIGTATPDEIAALGALVEGGFGAPPWYWVGPWSMVTNMLSPEASVLEAGTWAGTGATEGGAGITSDGARFGRSVNQITPGNPVYFGNRLGAVDMLPCIPGTQITGSFYGTGSTAAVQFSYYSGTGVFIKNVAGAPASVVLGRVSHTSIPPEGAAGVRMAAINSTQSTMPAFTWTDTLAAWASGRGCNRATVDGLGEAVQLAALDEPGMRRSSISFNVQELG